MLWLALEPGEDAANQEGGFRVEKEESGLFVCQSLSNSGEDAGPQTYNFASNEAGLLWALGKPWHWLKALPFLRFSKAQKERKFSLKPKLLLGVSLTITAYLLATLALSFAALTMNQSRLADSQELMQSYFAEKKVHDGLLAETEKLEALIAGIRSPDEIFRILGAGSAEYVIQQIRISEDQVVMRGQADDAAKLLNELLSDGRCQQAHYSSPLNEDRFTKKQVFTISCYLSR
ncbi:hypothetical protein [Aliiglaciecola sp. CAU 1673]|uniref:hypothetical protein n=1 Tax=Aliiglaciecola sp. CAU 1673 TaxID=3032595 RepID=UPI0023D97B0F|nr:hypothetical protein [Aliiglaciecola sp. CAU 1673]